MKVEGKVIARYMPDEFAKIPEAHIMEMHHKIHARADKSVLEAWMAHYAEMGIPYVVTSIKKPYDKAATLSIWKERVAG